MGEGEKVERAVALVVDCDLRRADVTLAEETRGLKVGSAGCPSSPSSQTVYTRHTN